MTRQVINGARRATEFRKRALNRTAIDQRKAEDNLICNIVKSQAKAETTAILAVIVVQRL
jgi:hypothetical protein